MSCVNFQACPVDEFAKWGGLAYKRSGNAIVAPAHPKAALRPTHGRAAGRGVQFCSNRLVIG